jgi:hypothetical protein
MDYIDKADQIDLASLREVDDNIEELKNIDNNIEESNVWAKRIGYGIPVAYATKEAARLTLQPAVQRAGAKVSIIIDDYYNPKLGKWEKVKMTANHFYNNEADEISSMVKKYGDELGISKDTNVKDVLIKKAKEYRMDISHIKKGGNPKNNMGQFRAALDEDIAVRRLSLAPEETPSLRGKYGKAVKNLRSENQWKGLNDILYDGKVTPERVQNLRKNGLSNFEKTKMGNLFSVNNTNALKNHGNALGVWGHQLNHIDVPITAARISNSTDMHNMRRAVTKDHIQQMAEHVMYKVDDLTDSKQIKAAATERFKGLQRLPKKKYGSLHSQVGMIDDEVARFMKVFKYNPSSGIATLNFSPIRKPVPLIGGFNANINYERYVGKDIIPIMQRKFPDAKIIGSPLYPRKIKKSYLYTDVLDIGKGARWVQKSPHITYMTNTEVLPYKSYRKSLKAAIKAREWDRVAASAVKIIKKTGRLAGRIALGRFVRI